MAKRGPLYIGKCGSTRHVVQLIVSVNIKYALKYGKPEWEQPVLTILTEAGDE